MSRRWRRALVALAVVALALVAVFPWGLNALGRWLVVADQVDKAPVIVSLVGGFPFRLLESAVLYRQGWAPEVWVTRENREERDAALLRLGIVPPRPLDEEVLVRSGVPGSAIRVLDEPIRNTMQEVDLIVRELRKVQADRVILVTSKAHTRRVRATWWARVGRAPAAIVRYAAEDNYDPHRWWRRTGDVLDVSREVFGMVNVWAGFPVQPDDR